MNRISDLQSTPAQTLVEATSAHLPRSADDVIDLRSAINTIFRGAWIIAAVTLVTLLLGHVYSVTATPIYRATSVILLEPRQQSIVSLESVGGGLVGDPREVYSEAGVLRSRSLMGRVVDELALTEDPEFNPALLPQTGLTDQVLAMATALRAWITGGTQPQVPDPASATERPQETRGETMAALSPFEREQVRERAINALLSRLEIRNIPRSLLFHITLNTEDPRKSAAIANAVARLYVQSQIDVKRASSDEAISFLTDRVALLKEQLETAEAEVAQFNASTDLVSGEALQLLEVQLKDIRGRIETEQAAMAEYERFLADLRAAPDRSAQLSVADDVQLTRLFPRAHSDAESAAAFDARVAALLAETDLNLQRARQQITALQSAQTSLAARIEQQGAELIRLQQLTREAEAVGLLYEYFLTRMQETAAQEGLQTADSRVLSDAVVPGNASSPRRLIVMGVALLAGLFLGTLYVLLREMGQNTFRAAQELEQHTGYAVLGQIPSLPIRNRKKLLPYLQNKPSSAAAESYRNLRTSLMMSNLDNPPQVILSTSCMPGEGKTTNSLALAQSFAGLGQKVLLIEGDIRRRTFSQYFQDLPGTGLVSVLSGDAALEDTLIYHEAVQAHILAGEKSSVSAADIFASDRFRKLISDLRGDFDKIIIDTPPILVVPDARIIAEAVDAILFTVQWDKTSKFQVDEAMRLFQTSGQRVSGCVLSQISPRGIKRYGYGGKYGVYSAYRSQYYTN